MSATGTAAAGRSGGRDPLSSGPSLPESPRDALLLLLATAEQLLLQLHSREGALLLLIIATCYCGSLLLLATRYPLPATHPRPQLSETGPPQLVRMLPLRLAAGRAGGLPRVSSRGIPISSSTRVNLESLARTAGGQTPPPPSALHPQPRSADAGLPKRRSLLLNGSRTVFEQRPASHKPYSGRPATVMIQRERRRQE